jgi:uncharacterized protein (DUF1800 family)
MDRRSFLTAKQSSAKPSGVAQTAKTTRTNSTLSPYGGAFGKDEIIHLLKRTMFGAKVSDVAYFTGKTLTAVVDELCTPVAPPSPPVNNYDGKLYMNTPYYDSTGVAKGATWVNAAYGDPAADQFRSMSYRAWWVGLMHNQGRSITEKMVLFWHNHFSTEINIVNDARYAYKHNATLRQYALGNFKQMVKAITLDPMMLRYLNGFANTKAAPDENYGREMQELFVCGKGPNSQYTEDDVKAAAKVLTGITTDFINITYRFIANNHDTSNKTFSSFYGNTVITGQTGAAGINEVDALMNMIFEGKPSGQTVPEAAYFICRKLYRWFVYYTIDAGTEANIIAPMAQALYSANWDISVPLKLLLKSEHFFDPLNMGCQIKSPVDYGIGYLREFNVPIQNSDISLLYDAWANVYNVLAFFEQPVGDPPNVAGWPAYYQEPIYYEAWINTDTLPKRQQIVDLLLFTNYGGIPAIDVIAWADMMSAPSNPGQLVNDALQYLFRIALSQVNKDFIKTSTLLSGQTNDIYWTQAWNLYKADPTNAANKNVVKIRLQAMLKYIVDLAEYNLA